ncbi:hypothetical protein [Devosia sp. SL43]|uniref:hypothetical protein n=1 Tax=Devosia sp. SL43 TaxID=2806348 RepID=UPI001F4536FD|nr:hypothetical protein [Devosia sp. SL43]UJW86795.1 hypothetical protein IM737_05970 [Devosia sp. SL43]
MIPASYFFKDIYKQSWTDADETPTVLEHRNRFLDGLMTPIAGAVTAVLHRRDRNPVRHYGVQAYD